MRRVLALLVGIALLSPLLAQTGLEPARIQKWEKDIVALEKRHIEKPPEKGGILFAGSSTIRHWDLAKSFPEWKAINCAFGGSEIRDVTHFAERIILKHEPKTIVFYAGDNDINANRKPEQVLADFRAFTETIHKQLPKARIHFICIKPSLARWKQFETQSKANALVKEFCSKDDRLGYIDILQGMIGKDGEPVPELFVKDGLHLTPKGYEVLSEAVRKAMK